MASKVQGFFAFYKYISKNVRNVHTTQKDAKNSGPPPTSI